MSAVRHCYSPDAPQTERLAAYLEEKEARVERRKAFARRHAGETVVQLALNIPGRIKDSALLRRLLASGMSEFALRFRSSRNVRSPMLQRVLRHSLRQLRRRRASRRRPRSSRPSIRGQGFLTLMSMMPAARRSLWLHVTGWAAHALSAAVRQRFACGKKAIQPKMSRKA